MIISRTISYRAAFATLILVFGFAVSLVQAQPSHPSPDASLMEVNLADYEGIFEGREFVVVDEVLTYWREGMPQELFLNRIGEDHFEINIPPGAVVQTHDDHAIPTFRFKRNEHGKVNLLEMVQPDGSVRVSFEKTSSLKTEVH